MRQIILIGFSTTGKSSLINRIESEISNFKRITYDTDKVISKDFNNSISNIFYQLGRMNALKEIERREIAVIQELILQPDSLIIAAGPGIPLHDNFKNYLSIKKPHVVLLKNSPENIYENLKKRRQKLFQELQEQNRSNFGIWDIGVITDENNKEFPEQIAIAKIDKLLKEREEIYKPIANFIFNTSDVLSEQNLPSQILEIL